MVLPEEHTTEALIDAHTETLIARLEAALGLDTRNHGAPYTVVHTELHDHDPEHDPTDPLLPHVLYCEHCATEDAEALFHDADPAEPTA